MRSFFYLIIFLAIASVKGQVGIGTQSPDASAALDIYSGNKGVLIPQTELVGLSNSTSPISNPAKGITVYHTGTPSIPQGHYYWNGASWDRMLINTEYDQILSIGKPNPGIVIPAGTANNYVSFTTVKANTIPGVSFSVGQDISLPTGIYRVDIDLTGNNIGTTVGTVSDFLGSNKLFVIQAAIVDAADNSLLTDLKTDSQIAGGGVMGCKFSFILNLATPKTVKLMLNHGSGSSDTSDLKGQHTGLLTTFYRFYNF